MGLYIVWGPICSGLSSLGFDLGRMRVHDPAGLSSAEALPENQDR